MGPSGLRLTADSVGWVGIVDSLKEIIATQLIYTLRKAGWRFNDENLNARLAC